jgi:hypothetical protein
MINKVIARLSSLTNVSAPIAAPIMDNGSIFLMWLTFKCFRKRKILKSPVITNKKEASAIASFAPKGTDKSGVTTAEPLIGTIILTIELKNRSG